MNVSIRLPSCASAACALALAGATIVAASLAACGGGGGDSSSTAPVSTAPVTTAPVVTPPVTTTPAPVVIAKQCIGTTAAIALGTVGAQLDLSQPVVVEMTNLSAPSTLLFQNLTVGGSYTISRYDLDSANNCTINGAASPVAVGASPTLTLTSFGASGTRHFVDLQQSTATIVQLCAQSGSSATACDSATQTVYGNVTDASKQALAGAKVTVANNGTLDTATTDAQGNFVLKTATATLPSAFSATISKAGYVPIALSFNKPASPGLLTAQVQPMTAAGANYAVIEVEPVVHHLGDSNYGGDINSQFQYPNAEGASFLRAFTVQAAALANPTATITFLAKGVQCADEVIINGKTPFVLSNSAADGSYSSYSFQIPVSMFIAGTNSVNVVSEACSSTDLDDFEFQNIVIHFQ